jgi:O-antigen ligase
VIRLNDLYSYDANDIGVVLLVGLGLTLLVLQVSRGFGKVLAAVILVGLGVTLARSGSRGAFVGLVVTGAAILVMLRTVPLYQRVAFALTLTLSLLLSAPPGYWEQMRTLLDLGSDYNTTSIDGRKEVANRGMTYMSVYPIFGLGINNFWRAECLVPITAKVRRHRAGTGIRCTPPHNSHVQAGAELGIPGLLLFWSLVFGGIWRAMALRRRLPIAWMKGTQEQRFLYLATMYMSVSMVGFASASTFVSFAWIDIVYILAALMAGLHVCARQVAGADPSSPAGVGPPDAAGTPTRRYRASVALPG